MLAPLGANAKQFDSWVVEEDSGGAMAFNRNSWFCRIKHEPLKVVTLCRFDGWQERDAEFQRDAVSGGSDPGVHSVVRGLSIEYPAS